MPVYRYGTPPGTKVACTAGTEKSLLEHATPSTRRCRPKRVTVSSSSVTASDPPLVVFVSQYDTAATGGTSVTPNPLDPAEPASLMTGATYNRTAMPTGTRVPLAGPFQVPAGSTMSYDLQTPDGDTPIAAVSKIVCVSALADAAGATQNVHVELIYEE